MAQLHHWVRESGVRLEGSRELDSAKLQAPGIVRIPGGYRLFYTAVGPAKPFPTCQGYLLSAVSDDGLVFRKEPGFRVAPRLDLPHASLRVLAPSVTTCGAGRWRMYFEARGPATRSTVICSAVSTDLLNWTWDDGIRLQTPGGVGGPRYLPLSEGSGRLYCFSSEYGSSGMAGGHRISTSIISAITSDGLHFEPEPGYRLRDRQADYDSAGITAAEVIAPQSAGESWTMIYSAWQDRPSDFPSVSHPSQDADAVANGQSEDFARASIASDLSGYRSRIFVAESSDGLSFRRVACAIDGAGYDGAGPDAIHAEDMSVVRLDDGRHRMYYAACDPVGAWRVLSAITVDSPATPSSPRPA